MASLDWKSWVNAGRERANAMPRWAWLVAAGSLLAAVLLMAALSRGPSYVPLYDGLSAKQGGQVINELQKLGISYQLNSSGSVIRVPQNDLARARLKLGQMDVPTSQGSQAWTKLTQGSMTTSATAENALSRRAMENRLRQAIKGINGVHDARVTLAIPKSTPFLKDQPHAKASVWLNVGPSSLSHSQAQAIAQMVANSVPGLETSRVTVTDQNGNVLAPASHSGLGQAQQQLQFTTEVEQRAESHIQNMLSPLLGAHNMRVSTAASIDFSQVNSRSVDYGPNSTVGQLKHDTQSHAGAGSTQQGVPGALSNEPPGSAAAPLKTAKKQSKGGAGSSQSSSKGAAANPSSQSHSNKWDVHYQVDQSTSVAHRPPWQLNALSVSVVLNQKTVGAHPKLVSQVKKIVSSAIAAPNLKVNIAVVPFGIQNSAVPSTTSWRSYLNSSLLLQAIIELLAALLILFGLAKPLARWMRDILPVPSFPSRAGESPSGNAQPEDQPVTSQMRVSQAQEVARNRPEESAEMLKRWISSPDVGVASTDTGGSE